jgi:nicotinamide riboside kinase
MQVSEQVPAETTNLREEIERMVGLSTLRIYVCGAHSTGKTTLARHISDYTGLPLLNEVARQVMAEREMTFEQVRADLRAVNDYQRAVFARQLEVEASAKGGFVSDRAFDNLAYAARHSDVLPELLSAPSINDYFERVRNSLVFFIRPHPSLLAEDGMREVSSWDEVMRIDGVIDFLLAWQRIPAIGISELGLRNRLRTAMTAVDLYTRGVR